MGLKHQTGSDASFSEAGKAAWDADHIVTGDIDFAGHKILNLGGAAGQVPIGGIIFWSGLIAAIPASWALCDGTTNAPGPDLRDKFVVGASVDNAGAAKTNIEGSLKVSGGATGHSHSGHAALSHAGGAVADHTGFTHGLSVANHPDLTHAALSHASMPLSHVDHAVASLYHTHAAITVTHADHSLASFTGSGAAITLTHADHSLASFTGTEASLTHTHAAITLTHADHSIASFTGTHASQTFSVPSGTWSLASQTATEASLTVSNLASLTLSISSQGTARTIATWGGAPAVASNTQSVPSVTGTVASSTGTVASGTHTHAAITVTHADHSVASFTGSQPSNTHSHAASTVTHADHSVASQTHSHAAQTVTHADHSVASFSGTHAAYTLTHADHSFPSLSHQDIGTHKGTDYGVHTITPPGDHGNAGTVTHSFTQPDAHAVSAHDTVSNVPSYYALAFIQRMS